jgi:membrane dipeptidase
MHSAKCINRNPQSKMNMSTPNTDTLESRIDRLHAPGVIDMHWDLLMDLYEKRKRANVLRDDFEAQLDAGGIGVVGAAIYIDEQYLPEQALRVGLDQIARLYVECESNPRFVICKSYADLVKARRENKFAVLITMEGVEPLGSDLNLLRVFYELGLRSVGLTHARRTMAADGGLFGANISSRGGLTPFGRDLVREMERLSIIVDLAHLNPAGVEDVLAMTTRPPIFSHVNPRKFFDIDRNASDDYIRAVGARGGVIGVNGALVGANAAQATLDMFIDNIEYTVELAGIDHVGLGFDFFKFIWDQWTPAQQAALNAYLAPPHFIADLEHHGHTRNLTRRLIARGWKEEDITKLLYTNWMRALERLL